MRFCRDFIGVSNDRPLILQVEAVASNKS
jgi:hypothetical protein